MNEVHICPACGSEWADPGVCSDGHPPEITESFEVITGEVIVAEEITTTVISAEEITANTVSGTIREGESLQIVFTQSGRVFVAPGPPTEESE